MKNIQEAEKLAKKMKEIGNLSNKETVCIITNMDEPLGYAVGNNIEVIEAIKALKGDMPEDIEKVVLELGAYMLKLAGMGDNPQVNKIKILEVIKTKAAFNKFKQLVENQGGNVEYIENINNFPKAKHEIEIFSKEDGYISQINAEEVGKIALSLGAGRIKKEDNIDYTAGIILNKKVGDKVKKEEKIATLYTNKEQYEEEKQKIEDVIKISKEKVEKPKTILEVI